MASVRALWKSRTADAVRRAAHGGLAASIRMSNVAPLVRCGQRRQHGVFDLTVGRVPLRVGEPLAAGLEVALLDLRVVVVDDRAHLDRVLVEAAARGVAVRHGFDQRRRAEHFPDSAAVEPVDELAVLGAPPAKRVVVAADGPEGRRLADQRNPLLQRAERRVAQRPQIGARTQARQRFRCERGRQQLIGVAEREPGRAGEPGAGIARAAQVEDRRSGDRATRTSGKCAATQSFVPSGQS